MLQHQQQINKCNAAEVGLLCLSMQTNSGTLSSNLHLQPEAKQPHLPSLSSCTPACYFAGVLPSIYSTST